MCWGCVRGLGLGLGLGLGSKPNPNEACVKMWLSSSKSGCMLTE